MVCTKWIYGRLWNIEKGKIKISRNIVFNENNFYYKTNKTL